MGTEDGVGMEDGVGGLPWGPGIGGQGPEPPGALVTVSIFQVQRRLIHNPVLAPFCLPCAPISCWAQPMGNPSWGWEGLEAGGEGDDRG